MPVEIEIPLGIRGLALRWAAYFRGAEDVSSTPLDTDECEALRGWVRRRMARARADVLADDSLLVTRVAPGLIMQAVADDLGLSLNDGQALCEWAGWTS